MSSRWGRILVPVLVTLAILATALFIFSFFDGEEIAIGNLVLRAQKGTTYPLQAPRNVVSRCPVPRADRRSKPGSCRTKCDPLHRRRDGARADQRGVRSSGFSRQHASDDRHPARGVGPLLGRPTTLPQTPPPPAQQWRPVSKLERKRLGCSRTVGWCAICSRLRANTAAPPV